MKKILLVEDTLHLSEEIADVLRLEKFEVTVVYNGLQALKLLKDSDFDLMITDLLMPGMDGFELIRQVRLIESLKSLPIVILSAKTAEADNVYGKQLGANAFILKPCKAHELINEINSLLR